MHFRFFLLAAAIASSIVSAPVIAQRAPIKLNQDFRYLGHFQSAGYHWRTPGPCVGYYNPYSRVNSALRIGGLPQGAEGYVSPSYGYTNFGSNAFDQPSLIAPPHQPGMASGITGGNQVPSVIDDSAAEMELEDDDIEEIQSDGSGNDESDLSELEAEVQSILNDSNQSLPEPTREQNGSGAKDGTSFKYFQHFDRTSRRPIRYPVNGNNRGASRTHPAWELWK